MKFIAPRDFLTLGLQQVLNVVGSRASMPILSNVLIEAKEGLVSFTTTNLDIGIECSIEATVEETGIIALPVRMLATIVRSLPGAEVTLETTAAGQAKIVSGGSIFKIMGCSANEFPPIPRFSEDNVLSFKQVELQQMLKNISYAQSGDESRYILNGVYFSFDKNQLTLVATDGRRLSLVSKDIEVNEAQVGSLIIPAKTVSELERLLGQGENVAISFTDRQAAFNIEVDEAKDGLKDSVYLVSKVVDGKYPDYRQVIPKQTDYRVKIEREFMQECVKRAALVTNDKNNSVKFCFKNNALEISASSPEFGESHESMAIAYEGPEVSVAFNPQFVLDPLKALTKDELFFEFKDEMSPGVFKTLDTCLCVIMPLRLT